MPNPSELERETPPELWPGLSWKVSQYDEDCREWTCLEGLLVLAWYPDPGRWHAFTMGGAECPGDTEAEALDWLRERGRSLLATLVRVVGTEWTPIDQAPLDGSNLVLRYRHGTSITGFWYEPPRPSARGYWAWNDEGDIKYLHHSEELTHFLTIAGVPVTLPEER